MKGYWHTSLFLFIIFYGTGQYRNMETAGLTCVSDYVTEISCVWWNSTVFSDQRCVLVGKCDLPSCVSASCELAPLSNQLHSRKGCSLSFEQKYFFFTNKFWLDVSCNGSVITKLRFHPGRHIKIQPPDMPTVIKDKISWNRSSNFPKDVNYYEFQVQVKASHISWEVTPLMNTSKENYVHLDSNKLTIGEEYQARARVKPTKPINAGYFRGEWSDWSPVASWRSEIGEPLTKPVPDDIRIILIIGCNILLVLIGVCLVICRAKKNKRSIKQSNQHVPDPSKYFQPLNSVHGGNFRKWLGCQNSVGPFLTPQSCDDISPVEVTDLWDVSLMDPDAQKYDAAFVHSNQMDSGLENSGTSQASSSVFSNMGYFYSKSNRGSLYLESCPVYFSYHPEEAASSAASSPGSSFGCLQSQSYQRDQPMSPDSGLNMPEEELCEDEDSSGAETCAAEGQALVSFIMSLSQASHSAARPAESSAPVAIITPRSEPARANACTSSSEPAEGAAIRPSSMIEPCGSGYLTLKEMQKYSNKSI